MCRMSSPETPPEIPPGTPFEDSRTLGRMEAERFEAALRAQESREREDRLSRLAWGSDDVGHILAAGGGESSAVVRRLQQDVERLAGFHHAVLHSKAWRVIQRLRRVVGRAW